MNGVTMIAKLREITKSHIGPMRRLRQHNGMSAIGAKADLRRLGLK
jgi:hypothetical protein